MKINDDIYRIYVTSALKILTTNTAKIAGGSELTKTYSEIVFPKEMQSEEEQQEEAKEIIANMKSKIFKVGKGRG